MELHRGTLVDGAHRVPYCVCLLSLTGSRHPLGYYYQPKRTAPKVVKPAELLVDPRSRYLQALSDLLNEIESARVREEEAENSDLKDSERGNKNEGNDEEMQQFVKACRPSTSR